MFGLGKKKQTIEQTDDFVIKVTEYGSGYPSMVTVVVTPRSDFYGSVSCPDGFGRVETGEPKKYIFSRAVGGAKDGEISKALTKWIQDLVVSVYLHDLQKGTVISLKKAKVTVSNPVDRKRL